MAIDLRWDESGPNPVRFIIERGEADIEKLNGERITIPAQALVAFAKWYVAHEPDEFERLMMSIATAHVRKIEP